MQEIKSLIIQFSQWMYPWLNEISMAIMATLLVIYGASINRLIKKQISSLHFIFRTIIFVLICAFGYGAFLVFIVPLLSKLLAAMGLVYLGPIVVFVFIVLGVIAEKKNQI